MAQRIKGAVGVGGQVYRAGQEKELSAALKAAKIEPNPDWFTGQAAPSGFDANTATKEELVAEAEKRGLKVTRSDGEDGEPLKADYVKALEAADEG